MTVLNANQTPGILKGGFQSFSTPRPATAGEWEKRKTKLRKTLWKLLGDMPTIFIPEATIHRRQEKDGYSLEQFTFDNGVGHTYTPEMWKQTLHWLKKHL